MSWFNRIFRKKKQKDNKEIRGSSPYGSSNPSVLMGIPTDLTVERENEMIDWLADLIVKRGFETPAILFFESIKPVSVIGSQLGLFTAAPFLEAFGVHGFDWAVFFNKRKNIERLLNNIEDRVQKSKKQS